MSIYSDYWSTASSMKSETVFTPCTNYFFFDKNEAWYKVRAFNLSDAIAQLPENYEYVRHEVYSLPNSQNDQT